MFRLLVLAGLLLRVDSARLRHSLTQTSTDLSDEKTGYGDNCSISVYFNTSEGAYGHGNDVGRLIVKVPNAAVNFTNRGFVSRPPSAWGNGMVLGKADEYIWPISGAQGAGAAFTFDHGASDIVFGDAFDGKEYYRPEFDELMFLDSRSHGTYGYGNHYSSPQTALQAQYREEKKESLLKFGSWTRDGYFKQGWGTGRQGLRYEPLLKLKDQGGFQQVGTASFQTTTLMRPTILDIDNLFAAKPSVPNFMRTSKAVYGDPTYLGTRRGGGIFGRGGGRLAGKNYGQRGGGQYQHVNSQCYPKKSDVGILFSLYCGRNYNEQCTTLQECTTLGGRWKNKYCRGSGACGCCKEIGMHTVNRGRGGGFIQIDEQEEDSNGTAPALAPVQSAVGAPTRPERPARTDQPHRSKKKSAHTAQTKAYQTPDQMPLSMPVATDRLPLEMQVEWLTPVLQKFQCVSVAPEYAKTGGASMFIAMGWDTESGVSDLDLDLSLVPVDKYKRVIRNKMVYYQQKAPHALSCGYGQYALQAFNDDRSGDEPGDDELVKMNLACLNQHHQDIEAVIVMVNIYAPVHLKWNQLDSAYMRVISGGREMSASGNFFVHDAEAVRSFVRLSGNDLKSDPDLTSNGLAVGMFFRQDSGNWAFSAIMKGVQGRSAPASIPHIEHMLSDLVYPANSAWDQTKEQKELHKKKAFGEVGLHAKAGVNALINSGQLPCVASKYDQANILLGHLTPAALQKVQNNANLPQHVRNVAGKIQTNEALAKKVQGLAQAVDKLEGADSEKERKAIANKLKDAAPVAPTEKKSSEAEKDLDSLFDSV